MKLSIYYINSFSVNAFDKEFISLDGDQYVRVLTPGAQDLVGESDTEMSLCFHVMQDFF